MFTSAALSIPEKMEQQAVTVLLHFSRRLYHTKPEQFDSESHATAGVNAGTRGPLRTPAHSDGLSNTSNINGGARILLTESATAMHRGGCKDCSRLDRASPSEGRRHTFTTCRVRRKVMSNFLALRRNMQNETGGQAIWACMHPLCRRHRLGFSSRPKSSITGVTIGRKQVGETWRRQC